MPAWAHPMDGNALREVQEMFPEEIWIVRGRQTQLTMKMFWWTTFHRLQDDQSPLIPNEVTQLTLEGVLRQPCPKTFTAPLAKATTIGAHRNLALIWSAANLSLF